MNRDHLSEGVIREEVIIIPVHRTSGGGYKYGSKGKTYTGKGAKAKASRQGRAIKASQARSKKK